MQPALIEAMHQQVRAIHRALTGDDLPDASTTGADQATIATESDEVVTQRFAELAAVVHAMPAVAARVPPFAFTPAVDVIAGDDAVILELAVPGIRLDDLSVECIADTLVVSGSRRDGDAAAGRVFHAEIPRGPFVRVIRLPVPVARAPQVDLAHGILRLRIQVASDVAHPRPDIDPNNGTNNGTGSEENRK